jgi:hypothetical protein
VLSATGRAWIAVLWLLACLPLAEAGDKTIMESGHLELEKTVRGDVVALHEFFVGWYGGELPESAFETEFLARLDPAFTIIMPSGAELDMASLSRAMQDAFGQKPGFRIEIRNVRLKYLTETTIVATYEEWQRNTREAAETGTGRLSTVVFDRDGSLRWRHVHETWLPEELVLVDPFAF